jgi:hypothetical protein
MCSYRQTLADLGLEWNQIGDKGAQYLAYALKANRVMMNTSFFLISISSFTGTY